MFEHTVNETVWMLISGMLGADGVRATGEASFCSIISEKDIIPVTITFFQIYSPNKMDVVAPPGIENRKCAQYISPSNAVYLTHAYIAGICQSGTLLPKQNRFIYIIFGARCTKTSKKKRKCCAEHHLW